jgi:membrane peptidoglycan carboxypeptidase
VYFGKSPKELTLGEAAFLAGVLPEPPRVRSELTSEKVYRCQRRALSRLAHFFPMRYSSQQIAQAMQERVVFVWER